MDHEFLVEHFYDEMEQDSTGLKDALSQKADTPDEWNDRFSGVTYYKGASIIRMMNYTVGHDQFLAGIRHFLKQK